MKNLKKLEILGEVHSLILSKKKGSASDLAKALGISRSSFYNYINELEAMGAIIKYSRTNRCFYYLEDFKLKIIIETNEMSHIVGGRKNNWFRPRFLDKEYANSLLSSCLFNL